MKYSPPCLTQKLTPPSEHPSNLIATTLIFAWLTFTFTLHAIYIHLNLNFSHFYSFSQREMEKSTFEDWRVAIPFVNKSDNYCSERLADNQTITSVCVCVWCVCVCVKEREVIWCSRVFGVLICVWIGWSSAICLAHHNTSAQKHTHTHTHSGHQPTQTHTHTHTHLLTAGLLPLTKTRKKTVDKASLFI